MKYIQCLFIMIAAVVAASCSTADEPNNPGGGGTVFIPCDVVDCTITGKVVSGPMMGKVWEVTEMNVYKTYKMDQQGKLTLVNAEFKKETFSDGEKCYVSMPKDMANMELHEPFTDLPFQMILEKGTLEGSSDKITLGTIIKKLTDADLTKPAE